MKKIIGAFVFCFWIADCFSQVWVQKADIGTNKRQGSSAFTISNKAYVTCGRDSDNFFVDTWEYDGSSNAWTQKADFVGVARSFASSFRIGNFGYVICGIDSNNTLYQETWEYDAVSNNWSVKASFQGAARLGGVGFAISNKGYVGTGGAYLPAPLFYNDFWEYDQATNIWTAKNNFPGDPRIEAIGFSIGAFGYLGLGGGDTVSNTNDFWQYDQASDLWTIKSSPTFFTQQIKSCVSFSTSSRGYVGTGFDGFYSNRFLEYNPTTDQWKQLQSFNAVRQSGVGFVLQNSAYIGAGFNGTWLNNLYGYDLSTNALINYNTDTICPGDSIFFGAHSVNSDTYAWFINGQFSSNIRYPVFGFEIPGNYWIKLIVGNSYNSDSDSVSIHVKNSIWHRKMDIPFTLWRASAFSIDSIGYFAGGGKQQAIICLISSGLIVQP